MSGEAGMRKRIGWLLAGAAAMAAVAVASSSGASPNAGPRDAVWGGGHFIAVAGVFERDFSVNAELGRFRGVDEGAFVYGRNETGFFPSVDPPSCLSVQGNEAVIGGVSHAGGVAYAWYAKDNGLPASGTRDEVSALMLYEESDVDKFGINFPTVCPTPSDFRGNPELYGIPGTQTIYSLPYGDVVARDAP
jgi:hypothetical protein